MYFLFNSLQFILSGAQTNLFCLIQSCLPLNIGVGIFEVVVVTVPSWFCQMFSKLAVGHRCSFQAGICTCLIQCNRVKTCKHSDIRKNCCVIFSMAVTVRADILYQRYMETWTSMTDSLCIFCHFAVQKLIGTVVGIVDSIKATGTDTTSATFTFIIIDHCFFVYISKGITAAFFCTTLASTTKLFVYAAAFCLHDYRSPYRYS